MVENGSSNIFSKSNFTSKDCELAPPNKGEKLELREREFKKL